MTTPEVPEVDADLSVVVDVAVVDYQVAVSYGQMDAGLALANEQVCEGCLHCFFEPQSDGFGVDASDFDACYDGHALSLPDVFADAARVASSLVRAETFSGGASTSLFQFEPDLAPHSVRQRRNRSAVPPSAATFRWY